MLTLPYLSTNSLPLLIRAPEGGRVALALGLRPKNKRIDSAVRLHREMLMGLKPLS